MNWFLLSLLLFSSQVLSSTGFIVEGTSSFTVAKSYDWKMGHGMLIVNKRNVKKKSFLSSATDVEKNWVSKFGSLTFNQYGTEFPSGGINEKGLVVEAISMEDSSYQEAGTTPSLNEYQWIQYQLDNYKTVQEVLSNLRDIRVSGLFDKVHYIVCDKTKECSTIEFINGDVVTHSTIKVLTNNNYAQSQDHLSHYIGFGGQLPIPTDNSSLSRFVRVSDSLSAFRRGQRNNVIEVSFTMLNSVRSNFNSDSYTTLWNIVYSVEKRTVHFVHTLVGMKKFINFSSIDFSCKTPKKIYNIESHQGSPDILSDLLDYKKSFNHRIVQLSLKGLLGNLPPKTLEKMIDFPDLFSCQES